jgi:hypothetical protein
MKQLKTSRKALRDRIRKYFKEKLEGESKPKFWSQGSMTTNTIINPIPREAKENGETYKIYKYDVDDGIYFLGKIEDRKEVADYHSWIVSAVDGHTDTPAVDKDTCVRTFYHDGHNIDQPIYYEVTGADCPQLAHKKKGWIDSDPREFTDWFNKQSAEKKQLIRLVRYFKAWCDFQNFAEGKEKMPIGLVMCIWVAQNAKYNDRDDVAMKDTILSLKSVLDYQIKLSCLRPTVPQGEELLESYQYTDFFRSKLKAFAESATQAINEENGKIACGKWQLHFGDRFSCSNVPEDSGAKVFSAPAIVTSNAKSANSK